MAGPHTQRRPKFLWQALLILLPVVVLAIVGALSLRQDRILAEHEATQRAQGIADDLLPRIWAELGAKSNSNGPPQLARGRTPSGRDVDDFGLRERDWRQISETIARWQFLWHEHEQLREVYRAAQPHFVKSPSMFFMQTQGTERWLAVRADAPPTNRAFICRPEHVVAASVKGLVASAREVPDYFSIGLEVGGKSPAWFDRELRTWREVNGWSTRTGGWVTKAYSEELATNVLASASKVIDGTEVLKVKVYLTSPMVLFKLQRARTFWFGALIAVSAIAALVGLATAWRAFQRQLRLSDMKSNFVSSVSHELRAPIASVRLLAESLERGKVSEPVKQNEYFRFIGQECRRLSSLIENLLDNALKHSPKGETVTVGMEIRNPNWRRRPQPLTLNSQPVRDGQRPRHPGRRWRERPPARP